MKPLRRSPATVTALVALALVGGCGAPATGGSGDGPSVVTSFYALEYVATRVAGGHADVQNLTAPGAEPHDLELTVAQTARLAEADVVFYLGGFQPAVDEAVEQNDPTHAVDAADLLADPDGAERTGEGHTDDGHGHEGDPHFWLDPLLLADAAAGFTEAMVDADPEHAASYRAGLSRLTADLKALDRDIRGGLADCEVDTVVVSHDAFGYLERYGLHFEPIAGLSPGTETSPARIAELHRLVENEQLTTVFSEPLVGGELAETVAADLDLSTAVLDPVEGRTEATADEDYLSLMRGNLAALREANRCR